MHYNERTQETDANEYRRQTSKRYEYVENVIVVLVGHFLNGTRAMLCRTHHGKWTRYWEIIFERNMVVN